MNAVYKLILAFALVGAIAFGSAAVASAAANPSGTGEPGAECGEEDAFLEPHGFTDSVGFAHAETVYAGSEGTASALNANSPHAVSQYDVACFQQTANLS
jgi:hypothetical protein